jgi:hypothetical protein
MMTPKQSNRIRGILAQISQPIWTGSVAEWCAKFVRFNEPKLSGPFTFHGREYLREPIDQWSNEQATDLVLCFGTRTGKTRAIFGGLAWKIEHSPTRAIWVMPNSHGTGGAQNVSRTRFQPMLRASETLARHIPSGARRHEFKTLQMCINGSIIDLTGAGSPANLAGNPCDTVVQDEVDKFKRKGESEADPSQLADQRCKEFSTPKRVKSSTPTLVSGKIWQELMKSDIRRRFVPCPHCCKHVVLAWSEQFTVLPKTGCEAYVSWGEDARTDAGWNLERIMETAHAVCPHCKGQIRDEHKVAMDAAGEWRPTQTGVPGYVGYHLPSMYSTSKETTFGAMAKRFLSAKRSLQGLQDFINSDLAEPYMAQDMGSGRKKVIEHNLESEAAGGWVKFMSVDCQQKAPYFWYVVRAWKDGNSEAVESGSLDTWEELRAKQLEHGVKDIGVIVDSGFGARSDAEVYRNCAAFGEFDQRNEGLPLHMGWIPAKGFPGDKKWKNDGEILPYVLQEVDPFMGTSAAGECKMCLLEFNSDFFRDVLEDLRSGRDGHKWAVGPKAANEHYWRHMDSHHKVTVENRQSGLAREKWKKRSERWPDHLNDCEIMQVVLAMFYRLFELHTKEEAKQ